jgi:hypothetical protein
MARERRAKLHKLVRGAGRSWGLGCEVELCLFETAVRDGGSDLKNPMSADRCPTQLPSLIHTGIHEAVGGTFSRRNGYRLTGPVSPTLGAKIVDQLVYAPDFAGGVATSGLLTQLGEHLLYACLSDISAPEEMPKPEHMDRDALQMPDALPGLLNVPQPHRWMKPVENMRDGLACCAENDALQPELSVAKDSDVSARQPIVARASPPCR